MTNLFMFNGLSDGNIEIGKEKDIKMGGGGVK